MAANQLEGTITIGTTDYSDEVTAFVIRKVRAQTQVPGTFADADGTTTLGSATHEVTIVFNYDEGDAAGIWAELYAGALSDSGELAFSALYKTGTVSATNPEFTGFLLVADIEIGGTVGELKAQSLTLPAHTVAMAVA